MGKICLKCGTDAGNSNFCPKCGNVLNVAMPLQPQQQRPMQQPLNPIQQPQTPPKKKHTALMIILIVIAVFILLVIIGGINSPNKSTQTNNSTSIRSADSVTTTTEAIEEVSATDLLKAYDDNEVNADSLYKGKIFKITGTISDIGVILNQTYITLKDDNSEYSFISVQAIFSDDSEITKVGALKKGDTVSVIGKVKGKSINVSVDDCTLVS